MFMVFAGDFYYPSGGVDDLIGIYPDLDSAKRVIMNGHWEWWHIFSVTDRKVVMESSVVVGVDELPCPPARWR